MKKSISLFLAACVMWIMTFQTSCIGSFTFTKQYWDWNSGLDRWLGGVFFLVLGGFITGITVFVDVIFFNLVEFWTGSNPMAMNEGDMEQQVIVGVDGNSYEVTVTKNRFDVIQLTGDNAGSTQAMLYNPENKSWSHEKDCEVKKLIQYSENGQFVTVFGTDGKVATVPAGITDKTLAKKMVEDQFASQICMK